MPSASSGRGADSNVPSEPSPKGSAGSGWLPRRCSWSGTSKLRPRPHGLAARSIAATRDLRRLYRQGQGEDLSPTTFPQWHADERARATAFPQVVRATSRLPQVHLRQLKELDGWVSTLAIRTSQTADISTSTLFQRDTSPRPDTAGRTAGKGRLSPSTSGC